MSYKVASESVDNDVLIIFPGDVTSEQLLKLRARMAKEFDGFHFLLTFSHIAPRMTIKHVTGTQPRHELFAFWVNGYFSHMCFENGYNDTRTVPAAVAAPLPMDRP